MNNAEEGFYKAFEDKFRGDREVIKSRLEVYLPFVNKLKEIQSDAKALDLGCGRGEWLELLRDNNVVAQGVDLDEGMLTDCQARGLQVETADALEILKNAGDESFSVISAFHVVEHISFDKLQILMKESLRVLRPGGLLILETPNPENITVATSSFYLDPTHEKPIPPLLLLFLTEHQGFYRSKILRLQESKTYENKNFPALTQVIEGVSPDYSIIAQKEASAEITALFNVFFNKDYGYSLNALSTLYDEFLNKKFNHFEDEISKAKADAEEASTVAFEAGVVAQEAIRVAQQSEKELMSIYNSHSWRITIPLRWMMHQVRLMREYGLKSRLRVVVVKIKYRCKTIFGTFIDPSDEYKEKIIITSKRIGMYSTLRYLYRRFLKNNVFNESVDCAKGALQPSNFDELPENAKKIYIELKSSLNQPQESK